MMWIGTIRRVPTSNPSVNISATYVGNLSEVSHAFTTMTTKPAHMVRSMIRL
jgi:hypothetical protein